jgi:hypothetical protein
MRDIVSNYCDPNSSKDKPLVARFLTIYIDEAHARDEWWLPDSPEARDGGKACIYNHRNLDDRMAAAKAMIKNTGFPGELVCDTMAGQAMDRFSAWPERLFIIVDGVVVYKGGPGPFEYKLAEVKDWLAEKFGLRGEPIARR